MQTRPRHHLGGELLGRRAGALPFWKERLERAGAPCRLESPRFGAGVLAFEDPAGLPSEIIECDDDRRDPPALEGIPDHCKVRGFHSVTLVSRIPDLTLRFFEKLLRFDLVDREDGRTRLAVNGGGAGTWVDLIEAPPALPWGEFGIGALHHVAFTVASKERMERLWQTLSGDGLILTDLRDRKWFHSMYMTEPGGINVEFSNVDPGFDGRRTGGSPRHHSAASQAVGGAAREDRERIAAATVLSAATRPATP